MGFQQQMAVLKIGTYQLLLLMLERRPQHLPTRSFEEDRFINSVNQLAFRVKQQEESNIYSNYLRNSMFGAEKRSASCPHKPIPSFLKPVNKTSLALPEHHSFRTHSVTYVPDCFSINILDWGNLNLIGLALDREMYLWPPQADRPYLMGLRNLEAEITCVKFNNDHHLALGTTKSLIFVADLNKTMETKVSRHQFNRINSMDWMDRILASASKNGYIAVFDTRTGRSVTKYKGHQKGVCTVKWNLQGNILASGGLDGKVCLFDIRKTSSLTTYSKNEGPIKALDWCPHNSQVLLSGSSHGEASFDFFNVSTLKTMYSINSDSQICNVAFSKISDELISTHGYGRSKNCINIWKSKSLWKHEDMHQIGVMTGHQSRVIFMATSPEQDMIVTCAVDRTLRLWRPFNATKSRSFQLEPVELR